MTINNSFATQITGQPIPSIASGKQTALGGDMKGGLAFFDLFLANVEKTINGKLQTLQTGQTGQTPPAQTQLLSEEANATILEALANSEYTVEELSKIENPQVSDVLALNQLVNDELLLTTEIPTGGAGVPNELQNAIITGQADFRPALNNLQRILQKLETLVEEGGPELIGANVTPQQITDLQKKVDDLLNGITEDGKTENEEFAGIFAGLIALLPPQAKTDGGLKKAEQAITAPAAPTIDIPEGASPSDELAAKLNDLMVSGTKPDTQEQQPQQNASQNTVKADAQAHTPARTQAPQQALPEPFEATGATGDEVLENPDTKIESVVKADASAGKDGTASKPQSAATPDLATLKAALPFLYSSDFTSGLYASATPVEGAAAYGAPIPTLTALSATASTSVLTHAHNAALPHPGTQMVAASLQRAGTAGENTTMTLQLDPPELGRVEIKMSFDKNSKIKAVLTAEKPETYSLLQRDSGVLERALQDAGLDSENGLSFELAKEGYAFGQDDRGGHGRSGSSERAEGESEEDLMIESTMNWAVDPQTGHMRYNITA